MVHVTQVKATLQIFDYFHMFHTEIWYIRFTSVIQYNIVMIISHVAYCKSGNVRVEFNFTFFKKS